MSTAPNPLVWTAGSLRKKRRVTQAVRNNAMLPGPDHIWESDMLLMFVAGLIQLGCWLSGLLYMLYIGQLPLVIWAWRAFHLWNFCFI